MITRQCVLFDLRLASTGHDVTNPLIGQEAMMTGTILRAAPTLSVAMAVFMTVGCGMGSSGADEPPPSTKELQSLCEQSNGTAYSELVVVGDIGSIENSLGLSGGDESVACENDAWIIEADGATTTIEMGMIFNPLESAGPVANDYCDTEGVTVQLPNSGYEAREAAGQPYCFSWYTGDSAQTATSSYVDGSLEVYLTWNVNFDDQPFGVDSPLWTQLMSANDAVITSVVEAFKAA